MSISKTRIFYGTRRLLKQHTEDLHLLHGSLSRIEHWSPTSIYMEDSGVCTKRRTFNMLRVFVIGTALKPLLYLTIICISILWAAVRLNPYRWTVWWCMHIDTKGKMWREGLYLTTDDRLITVGHRISLHLTTKNGKFLGVSNITSAIFPQHIACSNRFVKSDNSLRPHQCTVELSSQTGLDTHVQTLRTFKLEPLLQYLTMCLWSC